MVSPSTQKSQIRMRGIFIFDFHGRKPSASNNSRM
jgi:hypothetical protein